MNTRLSHRRARGFTLIELVIVMAMIGLLLSLALPQFLGTLDRGRLQVQRANLAAMREAIDQYFGDRGRYPDSLEDLVAQRYLRSIPVDPFTDAPTWVVVAPRDADKGGVIDVQSTGAEADTVARMARPAEDTLPNVVDREGGARSTVTAGAPAASAAQDGAVR